MNPDGTSLGRIKMKGKDLPGAEAEYKQAFAADAKSLRALAGLVNFYTEQKRFDDAFAVCAKAQEAARKGNILAALGRKAEARTEFETALKLNPAHAGATKDLKSL